MVGGRRQNPGSVGTCRCPPAQELLAIQQSDGPKNLGFFGTRNMGVTHQKLVEILAYAYASTVRPRGYGGESVEFEQTCAWWLLEDHQ